MTDTSQTTPQQQPEVDSLSYEQAREELVSVVSQLEAGGVSLETSLALWERGEALADRCEVWLEGAKARLAAAREKAEHS
jgi:exodeoxyribonuclease VII small subunit